MIISTLWNKIARNPYHKYRFGFSYRLNPIDPKATEQSKALQTQISQLRSVWFSHTVPKHCENVTGVVPAFPFSPLPFTFQTIQCQPSKQAAAPYPPQTPAVTEGKASHQLPPASQPLLCGGGGALQDILLLFEWKISGIPRTKSAHEGLIKDQALLSRLWGVVATPWIDTGINFSAILWFSHFQVPIPVPQTSVRQIKEQVWGRGGGNTWSDIQYCFASNHTPSALSNHTPFLLPCWLLRKP